MNRRWLHTKLHLKTCNNYSVKPLNARDINTVYLIPLPLKKRNHLPFFCLLFRAKICLQIYLPLIEMSLYRIASLWVQMQISKALAFWTFCRDRLFPARPRLWRWPPIACSYVQERYRAASSWLLSQRGLWRRHRDRRHNVTGTRRQAVGPQQHQVGTQLMSLQQGQLQPNAHRHRTREHRKR